MYGAPLFGWSSKITFQKRNLSVHLSLVCPIKFVLRDISKHASFHEKLNFLFPLHLNWKIWNSNHLHYIYMYIYVHILSTYYIYIFIVDFIILIYFRVYFQCPPKRILWKTTNYLKRWIYIHQLPHNKNHFLMLLTNHFLFKKR